MDKYFEIPTQVVFLDPNEGNELSGIAFQDYIICACCGAVFETADVEYIFPYRDWCDIQEEIIGGEYPEEYQKFLDNRG